MRNYYVADIMLGPQKQTQSLPSWTLEASRDGRQPYNCTNKHKTNYQTGKCCNPVKLGY